MSQKLTDRAAIALELEAAQAAFCALVDGANPEDLARQSNGTRWTNRQLLFHMLFGYRVVRVLVPLVKVVSRLPPSIGRGYAALLDIGTRPFNFINYWGSVLGSRLYSDRSMIPMFDAEIRALRRRLDREPEESFGRSMAYPIRWDPFFKDTMTLEDVFHFPTRHFEFHRRQLTIGMS
jgi:hypothetical protein